MATRKQYPTQVSPVGKAAFTHLAKPDTEGKYADNKYKLTLVLDKDDDAVDAFVAKIKTEHKAAGGKADSFPVKDGDKQNKDRAEEGKEVRDEFAGKLLVTFKSKFPIQMIDREKNELEDVVKTGDTVKVAFAAIPYVSGKNKGVTLQLRAVQQIEARPKADYSDAFSVEASDEESQAEGNAAGEADDADEF
jgi:hypothetical protein